MKEEWELPAAGFCQRAKSQPERRNLAEKSRCERQKKRKEKKPGVTRVPISTKLTFLPFFAYGKSNVDFVTCKPKHADQIQTSKKNCNKVVITIFLNNFPFTAFILLFHLFSPL